MKMKKKKYIKQEIVIKILWNIWIKIGNVADQEIDKENNEIENNDNNKNIEEKSNNDKNDKKSQKHISNQNNIEKKNNE